MERYMWAGIAKMATKIKIFIKDILIQIIWKLSEIEALFSKPNDYLPLRRIYLRLMHVKLGKILWIGKSFNLSKPGNLILGERCALGAFVRIENHSLIQIGDDFIAAPGLHLNSGNHDPITMEPQCLPIKIGERVWCGVDVTIISGVTVGDDVVIGAGSVVINDIPSDSIAAGVPAKNIKSLHREKDKDLWTWVTQ